MLGPCDTCRVLYDVRAENARLRAALADAALTAESMVTRHGLMNSPDSKDAQMFAFIAKQARKALESL